jgi:hypothetical protein
LTNGLFGPWKRPINLGQDKGSQLFPALCFVVETSVNIC